MTRARGFGIGIACVAVIVAGFDPSDLGAQQKGCAIEGASPLAFGTYDPIASSGLDVQGQISYRCGKDADRKPGKGGKSAISVQISLGPGQAGTFDRRLMGGRDVLRYNVYLDAARNIIWGDGTGGSQVFVDSAPPNNQLVTVPVFGRLFAGQDVASGAYTDNLVVTLDF